MSVSPGLIKVVALALGEFNQQAVFVGGSTVPFYLPENLKSEARVTEDIDVVLELVPKRKLPEFEDLLRKKGFQNDTSEGAPLCRWRLESLKVDIMTSDKEMLGFTNRWYADGVNNTRCIDIEGVEVQILTLPFFLATKLEAFKGRGRGDFFHSDMEDIVTIIDALENRQLKEVFEESSASVGEYLKQEFSKLVAQDDFEQGVTGAVSNRKQAGERARQLIQLIKDHL